MCLRCHLSLLQWHAGILAPYGGLDRLRSAEQAAKTKRIGVWEGYGSTAVAGPASNGHAISTTTTKGSSFDATVVRIWGSDQLSVIERADDSGKERRVQFASVRGPR